MKDEDLNRAEGVRPGIKKLRRAEGLAPKKWEDISMAFTRSEIREILGEAHTDEIATKLINLHRTVVDPLKDDLDSAKRDVTKYKAEAEKVPGMQKELDELKKDDWKAKYDNEKKAHDDYKAQVARDAEVVKVKAAYKKLLVEEKISEKALDSVLNATDYSKMKLKEDGTLDGIDGLKKDISEKWGGFKSTIRHRGENVDNPPKGGSNGPDNSIRSMTAGWHAERYGEAPAQSQPGAQAPTT